MRVTNPPPPTPPPPPPPPPPPSSAAPGPMPAGPPPYGPPGWGTAPAAQPSRPGIALAAMICGLAGLVLFFVVIPSLVALVLGLVAASRIKSSGGRMTGLAVARVGWITGLVGLLGGAAFVVAAIAGAFEDDSKSVFDLEVGDCVEVELGTETAAIDSVPVLDCDEVHTGEVFFVGELNPERDRDYPESDQDLFLEIVRACIQSEEAGATAPFQDYVGESYANSEFDVYPIAPDERAWEPTRGQFICLVTPIDPDDTLTGSVEGSGR